MNPDELVRDNLVCVYNSSPTDVKTKRKHTDWLDEYVNEFLLSRRAGTKRAFAGDRVCKLPTRLRTPSTSTS